MADERVDDIERERERKRNDARTSDNVVGIRYKADEKGAGQGRLSSGSLRRTCAYQDSAYIPL